MLPQACFIVVVNRTMSNQLPFAEASDGNAIEGDRLAALPARRPEPLFQDL